MVIVECKDLGCQYNKKPWGIDIGGCTATKIELTRINLGEDVNRTICCFSTPDSVRYH